MLRQNHTDGALKAVMDRFDEGMAYLQSAFCAPIIPRAAHHLMAIKETPHEARRDGRIVRQDDLG